MSVEPLPIRDRPTLKQIESLVARLRRRQVIGAQETALETALLLRQIVSVARFNNIDQLIQLIKSIARRLTDANPKEFAVGNIVRRVLRLIREESAAALGVPPDEPSTSSSPAPPGTPSYPNPCDLSARRSSLRANSLANFMIMGNQRVRPPIEMRHESKDFEHGERGMHEEHVQGWDGEKKPVAITVKPLLIQAIQEVIDELETVYENVAKTARDHIYDGEIILTLSYSRTIEQFLKSAARDRHFTVIVAETAPSYSGRQMATALSSLNIPTVLIPDSSIYPLMPRITKVILGAHAILANGGLFTQTGCALAAAAARAHSTPVVVCAGQFKLTPAWNLYHEYAALDFAGPEKVISFEEGGGGERASKPLEVVNPVYDYVAPELVDVLITNDGDHPPPYVYRLIKETYDDEDLQL
ncbi:nagb/rpia/CoA transferase-like protein [Dacryopinax primogenitus]|uniref:Translation initiation factor eIF2B subunit beta n=1 Tax=Dacryopinax primogenitus (strain DJM 731) TaxID=1858805 RepID=M5GB98_DACPD|nr:nagb/rpia/CoA transferase-like protein [Dacryopinax primogenitus]EJU05665.1 nagb/rpia/CoA transferase-like protein [Dacryopinax primogenitus]